MRYLSLLAAGLLLGPVSAQTEDTPPAVREVLEQLEQQAKQIQDKADVKLNEIQGKADREIDVHKKEALRQLMIMQDQYCKSGKLEEALEVREHIRQLRLGMGKGLPDPGYINNPQTDIGKVFHYKTTGRNSGSIYGTDIYTTGSDLGMAAVHCGILKVGEEGLVKVTILPGQMSYDLTTRYGITSHGYGQWGVSFKVEAARPPADKNQIRPDPVTLHAYRGRNGEGFLFEVTGSKEGTVYGSGSYTDDSTLAAAVVHAGLLEPGKAAVIKVTITEGRSRYEGSTKNGVTSKDYGPWAGSYKVELADVPKPPK